MQVQSDDGLHAVGTRLIGLQEILTVGAREGDRTEIIGEVAGLSTDADGNLYVLDSRYSELRTYDGTGSFVDAVGAPGEGPDEFADPAALVTDGGDQFYIADRGGVVKVLLRSGDSLSFAGSILLDFEPTDICYSDRHLYVQASRPARDTSRSEGTVQKLTLAGELVATFSHGYQYGNPVARWQMSEGRLLCSETGTIAVVPGRIPIVRGFSTEGVATWVSKFVDIEVPELVEIVNGGQPGTIPADQEYRDLLFRTVSVPPNYGIIQYFRAIPRGGIRREDIGLHSYLVDLETGDGLYLGQSLPRIYDVTESRVLASTYDPYPRVHVFAY